ncbi:MAG: malto-oligosyltrehalose synthase [bacterium]
MRIPSATYRLQFCSDFQFTDAGKIVGYLSELGISDIYASPVFKAHKGSTHGYDVIDFNQINPELGGADNFEKLITEAKQHGLGWLQDIVPNHMAYDSANQLLMDVLEHGRGSPFFDYFDVEWDHPYESIRGRILAPFLGEFYGTCLEHGEITLSYDKNGLAANYYDWKLPLKMESYLKVLTNNLNELKTTLKPNHTDYIKFLGVLYILKNLPTVGEQHKERHEQAQFVRVELWGLYSSNQEIKRFIDENIRIFNGEKGRPESFDLLDDLLSEQLFRLSFWKVATEEVNYRRFFTINNLICLRMQDENVFNYTHSLIMKLIREGKITGLRVDHIDGLYDPTSYLKKLSERTGEIYLVVEKILDMDEDLPPFWPVQGTSGYDFLDYLNEIFCDRKSERKMNKIYSRFLGHRMPYKDLASIKKKLLIDKHMTGDVDRLARLMKKIAGRDRHGSDLTLYSLKKALEEFLVLFPIYRTYISAELFSQADRAYISETVKKAMEQRPDLLYELKFIEKFFLPEFREYLSEAEQRDWIDFVMRFQQLTGPLMAKGFEDTTLYIYNRLISLNDVGGRPDLFGITVADFHKFNQKREGTWPHAMNASSTHDTKRGEDARARINILSEIPDQWEENLKIWSKANQRKKRLAQGKAVPDRNDEYLFYQALTGSFPFEEDQYDSFIERLKEYMIKAVKEAKVHTTWIKPDTVYEEKLISFIDKVMVRTEQNRFLKEFLPFQKRVAYYGLFNSLSQTLLKITSPGVPDFYRGTELWDFSFVDPDNRRPVDFEQRKSFLAEIREREKRDVFDLIRELLSTMEDGRIKLFITYRALQARARHLELFQEGDYIPLKVGGKYREHIIAFLRERENLSSITVVPRFLTSLTPEDELPLGEKIWEDTHLFMTGEMRLWKDIFTDRTIQGEESMPVGLLFQDLPVAMLFSL